MASFWCIILVCVFCMKGISSEASLCPDGNVCIPLSQCNAGHNSSILFPCHSGLNLYCCPSQGVKDASAEVFLELNNRKGRFPVDCGVSGLDDKITARIRTHDLSKYKARQSSSTMISVGEMEEKLRAGNQQHLLQFWQELDQLEQQRFMEQLSTIDFQKVNSVFVAAQKHIQTDVLKLDDHMQPIPAHQFEAENGLDPITLQRYRSRGLTEIASGHVAVLLLAGGQGTRLGINYPKGMFPLDLPSGKTLFQIQAERIRRIAKLAEKKTGKLGEICWYIMTSPATHEATAAYLDKHNYFGLHKEDVVLFQQGLFPCFDFDGKIILEEKNSIAMAPDGNGGIYAALTKNKIVQDMKQRGIKYVHVHSVDNILVKVADPVFIGYFTEKGADCGAKVIPKKNPHEPVGVVCQVNGRIQVVEYSEITERTANLRDEEGTLLFNAGSICNHIFTVEFLEKVSLRHEHELKLHVAKKKIPYINHEGKKFHPTGANGIKIEKFIFDAFEFSSNFVTWEVAKFSEFSPLKNCDDNLKNCPSTCRKDLLNLHRYYIENAGGTVLSDEVEISPLLSYAGENLRDRVMGKVFDRPMNILSDEEQTIGGL